MTSCISISRGAASSGGEVAGAALSCCAVPSTLGDAVAPAPSSSDDDDDTCVDPSSATLPSLASFLFFFAPLTFFFFSFSLPCSAGVFFCAPNFDRASINDSDVSLENKLCSSSCASSLATSEPNQRCRVPYMSKHVRPNDTAVTICIPNITSSQTCAVASSIVSLIGWQLPKPSSMMPKSAPKDVIAAFNAVMYCDDAYAPPRSWTLPIVSFSLTLSACKSCKYSPSSYPKRGHTKYSCTFSGTTNSTMAS
mmetsp:Transcript_4443/g.17008  ORF Transcript_4443/g.17008 Transcript_4443/m.17008 type:complete len:252 (+) Transcript_4443:400-1155(+)